MFYGTAELLVAPVEQMEDGMADTMAAGHLVVNVTMIGRQDAAPLEQRIDLTGRQLTAVQEVLMVSKGQGETPLVATVSQEALEGLTQSQKDTWLEAFKAGRSLLSKRTADPKAVLKFTALVKKLCWPVVVVAKINRERGVKAKFCLCWRGTEAKVALCTNEHCGCITSRCACSVLCSCLGL